MPFISLSFAAFFAVVAAVNFLLPLGWRWAWLLAASCVFYAWGDPVFLAQILVASGVTYVFALVVDAAKTKPEKQRALAISIVLLAGNLLVFKYTSFFNESARAVASWFGEEYPIPPIQLPLPLGISFYTFLLIGYLVDVYRGAKAERNIGAFALFATFFPKVVSGPIERSKHFLPQVHAPKAFDAVLVAHGMQLILWGVFKKAVVADRIAPFVHDVYSNPTAYDGVAMTSATWMYAFQVYCDFSGYTDIAIGVAAVLGYKLLDNFNRPYFATSIQDFWKRWHISLTTWLTDYVFTPLTRQKMFKVKFFTMMLIGMFLTFLISGLWHGAAWTFVVWGCLHGGMIVASLLLQRPWNNFARKSGLINRTRLYRAMKVALTFVLVCYAYIWFRSPTVEDALYMTSHILTGWTHPWTSFKDFFGYRINELVLALAGIAIVFGADVLASRGFTAQALATTKAGWLRWGLYYCCLVTVLLVGAFYGSGQQFIYFRF